MDLFTAFLLLLAFTTSLLPTTSAVQCYICSWSPNDQVNRTDLCTTNNFEPRVVVTHECTHGCETYVQWDKNEALEHWRRNCRQTETEMTGDCVQREEIGRIYRHCTCESDLCNSAISWSSTSLLTSYLAILSSALLFMKMC